MNERLKAGEQRPRPRKKAQQWRERAAVGKAATSVTSKKASKPVARNLLKKGAVIRARIEFQEGGKYKARPCVVLGIAKDNIDVLPIFSEKKNAAEHLKIADPKVAGLPRSSYFKVRIETIDIRDSIELLGTLSDDDHLRLDQLLEEHSSDGKD
jgi:hypothetical protein